MILIFEQDTRKHPDRTGRDVRFAWRPDWFSGYWDGGTTWRLSWGLWSLSYYPSPGLHDFMRHIEGGNTAWYNYTIGRTDR